MKIPFAKNRKKLFVREDKLLINLLADKLTETHLAEIQRFVQEPLDWHYFVDRAYCHKIIPIIYWNMKRYGLYNNLPHDVQADLQKGYLQALATNTAYFEELNLITKEFYDAHIDFIVLKGAAFAQYLYTDMGLRMFSDIDIFVKQKDMGVIDRLLAGLGFIVYEGYRPLEFFQKQHFHYVYLKKTEFITYSIEIHWDLFLPDSPIHFDLHSLWEKKLTLSTNSFTLNTFQWEDHFLYLCAVRCGHDNLASLLYFYDLMLIAQKIEAHSWNQIENKSKMWGIEEAVACCTYIIKEIFDITLPYPAASYLRKSQKIFIRSVFLGHNLIKQHVLTDWTFGRLTTLLFFKKSKGKFLLDYLIPPDKNTGEITHIKRIIYFSKGVKVLIHFVWSTIKILVIGLRNIYKMAI